MRRTPTQDSSSANFDRQREAHLKEIQDLERRLKAWKLDLGDEGGIVQESKQVHKDIHELIQEEVTPLIEIEVSRLETAIKGKYDDMKKRTQMIENELMLLENEIKNKIQHKMDSEDIKYSIFRRLLYAKRLDIYTEATQCYQSILLSQQDIRKQCENKSQGRMSISKVLQSAYYENKVKAKLCYETCYRRLMDLSKYKMGTAEADRDIIQQYLIYNPSPPVYQS